MKRFAILLTLAIVSISSQAHATLKAVSGLANVPQYIATQNGVTCNGMSLSDASITSGNNQLSSASYSFVTPGDVGKYVGIAGAGAATETGNITNGQNTLTNLSSTPLVFIGEPVSGTGIPAGTTVATITSWSGGTYSITMSANATATTTGVSVKFSPPLSATITSVSGGVATISVNAGTTVSGGAAVFGTDTSSTFNSLISTVNSNGGGVIMLPPSMCVVAANVNWKSLVSLYGQGIGATTLEWISTSDLGAGIITDASGYSYSNPITDIELRGFTVDGTYATQSSYNVSGKGISLVDSVRSSVHNVKVVATPATGIATDFGNPTSVYEVDLIRTGRLAAGQYGGNGVGEGINSGNGREVYDIHHIRCTDVTSFCAYTENQSGTTSPNVLEDIGDIEAIWTTSTISNGTSLAGAVGSNSVGGVFHDIRATCVAGDTQHTAVAIDNATENNVPGYETIVNDVSEENCYEGMKLDYSTAPGPSTAAAHFTISNVRLKGGTSSQSTSQDGIYIKPNSSSNMVDIEINNPQIFNMGRAAIIVSSTGTLKNLTINGGILSNNSQTNSTAALAAGLVLNANVNNLVVSGLRATDEGAGTQKYAISFANASDAVTGTITGGDFSGNVTAPFNATGTFTGIISGVSGLPAPTISGCSATSAAGNGDTGKYTSGTTGTCAVTVTPFGSSNIKAPNGWVASAYDSTTTSDVQSQTADTQTSFTISGTTASSDVVKFTGHAW